MKNILRALVIGIFMMAFTATVAVNPVFAQTEPTAEEIAANTALYKKYTDNRAGTVEQKKIAIETGKQYVETYGANTYYAAQVNYIKGDVPKLEAAVAAVAKQALYSRFDTSLDSKNYDETYSSGREILAQNPDLIDVVIVLGSVGYDESLKPTPNAKYNADTINYAKQAIQKIEGGAKTENYGAKQFTYSGVKEFPDAKQNALGWLNYNIAYLMYFQQNQKKEAIPYFYKATKYNSGVKNFPVIYQTIGDSYFEEAKRLNKQSEDQATAAGNKDTDESKASDALAKGYADRAIDAYARAYKLASTNTGVKKEYKDGLYKLLQELFKFRFNGKIEGLDSYVATVMNKPFVDPSTAVTPAVIEATPAATSTSSSLSTTSNTSVAATAQPVSTGRSTAKTPATAAATTKTAETAKTKAPAKKAAPKKKGAR